MARKLVDPRRSKAIVNDAWERIRTATTMPPNWNYIALVQIVDTILVDWQVDDARDLGDAIVLCHEMRVTPTRSELTKNLVRVDKGRQRVSGYR